MTPSDLQRLRALCDKATIGPWEVTDDDMGDGPCVATSLPYRDGKPTCVACYFFDNTPGRDAIKDAAFIAAARSAVPELLDEVAALRSAYRVMQEEHAASCPKVGSGEDYPMTPACTCGLHARKAEARRILEGEK